MYRFFIHDVTVADVSGNPPVRIAVVFCPEPSVDPEQLNEELRIHFDEFMPPNRVLLLGTAASRTSFKKIIEAKLIEGLPMLTRSENEDRSVSALYVTNNNSFKHVAAGDRDIDAEQSAVDRLRHHGLVGLFQKRNGLLESGMNCHYEIPSQYHCDKFVRTANVLIASSEISFISFWLLPYFSRRHLHIYTDTAAINSVAYALRRHADALGSRSFATIDSFGSYRGLSTFQFDGKNESLFLISASTSGGLAAKLVADHKVPWNNIVTLFYLGGPAENNQVLCDLTKPAGAHFSGLELVQIHRQDNCALCNQGSYCIRIVGDQFIPENPKVTQIWTEEARCTSVA
jgi:hypothetical protein